MTKKAAELFGYNSPEDLINSIKDIEELFKEKYRVNMKERRARRYETKETSIVELVGLRKDGTEVQLLAGINVTNWKGEPAIQCTYYDITAFKHAEEALRKYERIVASSNDHMALLDRNYLFLTVNDAYLQSLDKKREDIVGHSVSELFGQKFFEKNQKPNIDRCLSGEIVQYQTWVNFPGIGQRYMDVVHYPYYEGGDSISGYVENARDITEQKDLENRLQQAQKMEAIGTLASGIAHDFNNILGIILGNTELAMVDVPEWNPARSNLEVIKKAGLRAKDVIRQLLSFSRKTEYKRNSVKIAPLIEESVKFLRSSIPSRIEIRQNISVFTDVIFGDPTQIHQVMINLCANAAHAIEEEGGIMEISLTNVRLDESEVKQYQDLRPGPHVILSVSDTGSGIDPEIKDRIFDPYFSTKDINNSSGMGLAVVHGIVKNHDGDISIESEPGKGTAVHVLFPAVEAVE